MILFTTIFTCCLDSTVFNRILGLFAVKHILKSEKYHAALHLCSYTYTLYLLYFLIQTANMFNEPNKHGNAWHSSYQMKKYKNKTIFDLMAHIGVKGTEQ